MQAELKRVSIQKRRDKKARHIQKIRGKLPVVDDCLWRIKRGVPLGFWNHSGINAVRLEESHILKGDPFERQEFSFL